MGSVLYMQYMTRAPADGCACAAMRPAHSASPLPALAGKGDARAEDGAGRQFWT